MGGDAATVTRTGWSSLTAAFEAHKMVFTVGAALKCVIFSSLRSFQMSG